ncbi:hypothetical protein [Pelagicoccus sp. SDUM812002]|uniref:hypothetical protein n=1 Tax=Pelagicoccus sp. SDUM812002 TaxID=3041266 RepID=UPI00280CE29A|nr:hypothetical protein [Pelagicoccus sp. SDUM812002]MDQ8186037.1 hypothetical protein [Pelagicoccus sp. SDUM812002]
MDSLNRIVPGSEGFVDWSEAYERVEAYFCALHIRDRLLLSQLVAQILSRAAERFEGSAKSASVLAMEEAKEVVRTWFGKVLDAAGVEHGELGAQGRLALFLADMPTRWQNEFLHPGPWPEAFLEAMKATYLSTGPEFSKARMTPRDIDLGPVSAVADETWRVIDRWPILGALFVWTLYLGGVGLLVYLLH